MERPIDIPRRHWCDTCYVEKKRERTPTLTRRENLSFGWVTSSGNDSNPHEWFVRDIKGKSLHIACNLQSRIFVEQNIITVFLQRKLFPKRFREVTGVVISIEWTKWIIDAAKIDSLTVLGRLIVFSGSSPSKALSCCIAASTLKTFQFDILRISITARL